MNKLPAGISGSTAIKVGLAFSVSTIGMHYLNRGRNEGDFGKMVRGSLIILASLLLLI